MDILSIILTVVAVVMVIVLTVVGVQVFLVMTDLRRTLQRLNHSMDGIEDRFHAITSPLQRLGGMMGGLTAGIKVFESFVSWLHRTKEDGARSK